MEVWTLEDGDVMAIGGERRGFEGALIDPVVSETVRKGGWKYETEKGKERASQAILLSLSPPLSPSCSTLPSLSSEQDLVRTIRFFLSTHDRQVRGCSRELRERSRQSDEPWSIYFI
jgi:hypothetical protein